MRQNEMGFTFAGRHTSEFGLVYVESKGHPLTPEVKRNEYTIAGKSGTVLMPGSTREPLPFSGSLFLVDGEPETQREAQQLAREIMAWLGQGRQQLIFDYEPDRYYLAQVDKSVSWSLANWFGGEIGITFIAQPYAYNVTPDTASVQTTAASTSIPLEVHTLHPAPLEVKITNTGEATITQVQVAGGKVDLQGISLQPGHSLTISMEEPINAFFDDGRTVLPHAKRFDLLGMSAGPQTVPVALAYEAGKTPGAEITATVRGRW